MPDTHGRARRSTVRLVGAVMLMISLSVGSTPLSSAAPSAEELRSARARLDSLNEELSLLVERYNQTRLALGRTEERLRAARGESSRAQAEADRARVYLSARAAQAYRSAGSEFDALLGSGSLSEFTYRLEFLNRVAEQDANAIAQAEVRGQEARRAALRFAQAAHERTSLLRTLDERKASIEMGIAEQERLVDQLEEELARAERAARARAEAQRESSSRSDNPPDGGGSDVYPAPKPQPEPKPKPDPDPRPGPGAAAAVSAAYSVIGVKYRWGGDDPEEGFDCSGLTMWAWRHGGVNLPHSSAAQYAATPRVSRGNLRPGDLLFFYRPIHHVSMYVGGNKMIHARGQGKEVGVDVITDYWWGVYVGAGRPGA
jgi:cell wall-associated NlpC family hydrolase